MHQHDIFMRNIFPAFFLLFLLLTAACKNENRVAPASSNKSVAVANAVKYAKGLEIYKYSGYSVVKVTNPWPDAKDVFTYVMHRAGAAVPDSLKQYNVIQVPIKRVVVTSTTHIPSLEMLGVENTLVGFPNTDYISSDKTRALIEAGRVAEAGSNESLNTEVIIDLAPDAIVGFSISSNNKALSTLQQSSLNVLYNGDWTEQSPLGKAEWIKFFGALYGLDEKAEALFSTIENEYQAAQKLALDAKDSPTVMSGALFQDQWFMPQGGSWGALFIKDAHASYLWSNEKGTGSLSLPFESVLDKAQNAQYWIGPGEFTSLKAMKDRNVHYAQFKAYKDKNVYSYSSRKGKKGGILYYELAPNRPDIVLKDMIKILHPELLPDHELHFFEKLN